MLSYMTKQELIALLADYPDDTPIFDGRGYDLHATSIAERAYDDWEHATPYIGDDGAEYETPAIGRGISIGPRF